MLSRADLLSQDGETSGRESTRSGWNNRNRQNRNMDWLSPRNPTTMITTEYPMMQ